MSEMEVKALLADQQARGAQAESILINPLFVRVLNAMRKENDDIRKESGADEQALREECFHTEKAIDRIEAEFKLVATTGISAGKELSTLENQKEEKS